MPRLVTLAASTFVLCCYASSAAASFIGPSPYVSAGDSPFVGGAYSYFYLEDFEDGLLNTPGVTGGGVVAAPGLLTDSVDADDGAIDGSGAGGHSLYSAASGTLEFEFDAVALGTLPTVVGIVWTDVGTGAPVPGFDTVTFEAFDPLGASLGSVGPFLLGDGSALSATAEDRFFGVMNAAGISRIAISMATSTDWEVDHLEYGAAILTAVPEPATILLVSTGSLAIVRRVRRRRARS